MEENLGFRGNHLGQINAGWKAEKKKSKKRGKKRVGKRREGEKKEGRKEPVDVGFQATGHYTPGDGHLQD